MQIVSPKRATRTYTQQLTGDTATVFPLLCPVREADWIVGWDPLQVITSSGLVEPDCVFVTPGAPQAVWYVTRHEPERGLVEMLKVTPDVTACRLRIEVRDHPPGCAAKVTYSHTSLGPRGDEFVDSFTEEYYTAFMQDWEERLNHYLAHGRALSDKRS